MGPYVTKDKNYIRSGDRINQGRKEPPARNEDFELRSPNTNVTKSNNDARDCNAEMNEMAGEKRPRGEE